MTYTLRLHISSNPLHTLPLSGQLVLGFRRVSMQHIHEESGVGDESHNNASFF